MMSDSDLDETASTGLNPGLVQWEFLQNTTQNILSSIGNTSSQLVNIDNINGALNALEDASYSTIATNSIPDVHPLGLADQGIGLIGLGVTKGTRKVVNNAQVQSAIRRIDNIIRDHLKRHDITGTIKDMLGTPVPKRSGGVFNHLQEMNDSLRGLRRHANTLKNVLSVEAQKANQRALQAIDKVSDAIKGIGL